MIKLMEKELNMIAGGNMGETCNDSRILKEKGYMDKSFGEFHMLFHWVSDSAAVDAGWARAGIRCVTKPTSWNSYYKNGQEITRDEALKML